MLLEQSWLGNCALRLWSTSQHRAEGLTGSQRDVSQLVPPKGRKWPRNPGFKVVTDDTVINLSQGELDGIEDVISGRAIKAMKRVTISSVGRA
jgi:hypothetical protein